jgi:Fur family ferric uptake transcriptional regulator
MQLCCKCSQKNKRNYIAFALSLQAVMDLSAQIREKKLKATPSRLSVIKVLKDSHLAFSHAELESLFGRMDRVTLYRILNDFEEAGLVHKIVDMEGVTRFALCNHSCPGEQHEDTHVHFCCKSCHKMFCLEKVHAPVIKIPQGFKATGLQTVVYGLCKECNAN